MSDEMKDTFGPIRDAEGNVTGIMDRTIADYLASQAPDPTQASLDALLAGVTRVRVVSFANFMQGTAEKKVLLDTSDRESLAAFRNCLVIVEDPKTFGHCMWLRRSPHRVVRWRSPACGPRLSPRLCHPLGHLEA